MGMFSDLLANAVAIDVENPIAGPDLHAVQELKRLRDRGDAEPSSDFVARDEVQSLSVTAAVSGNFTLTFNLASGESFTTGNILFNDTAATIEGLIDTAATSASIVGWTNGDISVSGGAANANPTVFTFDGDSVANQNHGAIVPTDVDLSDGTPGEVTTTQDGQPNRDALGALHYLGAISGSPAGFKVNGPGTLVKGPTDYPNRPSASLVNALLREASHLEGIDYKAIYDAL